MYPKRIPKHLIIEEPYQKRKSKAWMGWLLVLLIAVVVTLFSVRAKAQSGPPPEAGHLVLNHGDSAPVSSLHLDTQVSAVISGMVVTVQYVQRFRNDSDEWVNGVYLFPLPEHAAIHHMELQIGERTIVGAVKERKIAEQAYEKAKAVGKQAALTLQQRPNLFTQKVANIGPREVVEVHLQFVDKATYQSGVFEWRLPTTITPRYIPGIPLAVAESALARSTTATAQGMGWAIPTDQVPDAPYITGPMTTNSHQLQNPLGVTVQLQSGMELASISGVYHDVNVVRQASGYSLSLQSGLTEMDRDFLLQWRPLASERPQAAVFQQQIGEDYFAMLMLTPPSQQVANTLPREILFVVDTSGSMQGNAIEQAKSSLTLALEQLTPNDTFNIIEFNSHFQFFAATLTPATQSNKGLAKRWVNTLEADGGTNMYPALSAAYNQFKNHETLQQIVFITDGAVGNEEALFTLITTPSHQARLFPVGIGSAPNTFFMTKAAQLGRGSYEFIANPNDVHTHMSRLFTKLNHVAATNITIDWPEGAEAYPQLNGDLYLDEPLVSIAKLPHPLAAVSVAGETAAEHWNSQVQVNGVEQTQGVSTLWARQKVAALEDQGRSGNLSESTLREVILEVALRHSLLTRFTAFLAIDELEARPKGLRGRESEVPNHLPNQVSLQSVAFARTATSAQLSFVLGTIGAIFIGVWRVIQQARA